MKDRYKYIVKSQYKRSFGAENNYMVSYAFEFKKNPLDATNCSAMVKMIEDIVFLKDEWDKIDIGGITSRKSTVDRVTITVEIKGVTN
jgi:hypothetical protein